MSTLTNGNLRILQHIDDSVRVGEIVIGDTREIRTCLSDLARRVRGSATFDGNVSILIRLSPLLTTGVVSSGSSLAKILRC